MICSKCNIDKNENEFVPSAIKAKKEKPHYSIICRECTRKRKIKKQKGYIYIISNPAWKGWIKIGVTTTTPEQRLQAYQTSSPFRDYKIEYSEIVDDISSCEIEILETLGKETSHEWIKSKKEEVIKIINKHKGE